MKFCPVCATPLNGSLECKSCGFKTTEEEIEARRDKAKVEGAAVYFTEPDLSFFNNTRKPVEKKQSIKLKELLDNKIEEEKITSLSYSGGGGMQGGHFSVNLYFDKNELVYVNQQFHYTPTITKTYSVTNEKLNEIRDFIEKYNFPAWSEIATNEAMRPTDISVTNLYLRYPDRTYDISFITNFDKEEEKIFFELRDLVYSCVDEENLKETKEQPSNTAGFMDIMGMGIIKDKNDESNQKEKTTPSVKSKTPKFCPECGSKLEEGQIKCNCGYEIKG